MFYSRGITHLGFPLQNIKGDGDNDNTYSDSPHFPFFLASNLHYVRTLYYRGNHTFVSSHL
jgi:hypothetical protein